MKTLFYFFIICISLASRCDARINFVHIPKTAGTTLMSLLENNFNKDQWYPYRKLASDNNFDYTEEDVTRFLTKFSSCNHELMMGHFPLWFFKNKDPEYEQSYFVTVLRDPVERVLSHYAYLQTTKNHKVDSCFDVYPNMMCKMLCTDVTLEGRELLKNSIKNLHRMDFIIFQDDFDNGVRSLFSELNLELKDGRIPVLNKSTKEKVSMETIKKIKKMNRLDVSLYKYAKKHFKR